MRFAPTPWFFGLALAVSAFPAGATAQPGAPAAEAPGQSSILQGTVQEVLAAPPYSYLRLKTAQGEVWAAVPAAEVKPGATVTVQVQVRMARFESPSLKRTFDAVYMGNLAGAAGAAPAHGGPAPVPAHGAQALPPSGKVAKAKGADAYTIAELYARKAGLKGRTVTVRAKVLKYREGIMGKTWIHLGDGSGGEATRDADLTATTSALAVAQVGEVVTVRGVLGVDRDLGSGYVYPILLENAALVR